MSDLLSEALFESGLDEFLQASVSPPASVSPQEQKQYIYEQPIYVDNIDSCVNEEVVITQPVPRAVSPVRAVQKQLLSEQAQSVRVHEDHTITSNNRRHHALQHHVPQHHRPNYSMRGVPLRAEANNYRLVQSQRIPQSVRSQQVSMTNRASIPYHQGYRQPTAVNVNSRQRSPANFRVVMAQPVRHATPTRVIQKPSPSQPYLQRMNGTTASLSANRRYHVATSHYSDYYMRNVPAAEISSAYRPTPTSRLSHPIQRSPHTIQYSHSASMLGYRQPRTMNPNMRQVSPVSYQPITPARDYSTNARVIPKWETFPAHETVPSAAPISALPRRLPVTSAASTPVSPAARRDDYAPRVASLDDQTQDCLSAPRLSPQHYPTYCESVPNVSCRSPSIKNLPKANNETAYRQPVETQIPKVLKVEETTPEVSNTSNINIKESFSKQQIMAEEDEIEQIQVDTYVDYFPPKLRSGLAHPDNVVETVSLNSVTSPEIRYHMSIPEQVVDVGHISALQLEAALYACQAHEKRLPSGERVGYLIGDGAGVGKGRIIATIIYENYILGRKRAIWLSVSSDLKFDAERDLNDIGAGHISVHALNKMKYAKINGVENSFVKKGVLFSTYASLIGECRSVQNTAYSSRLKQVLQWCGKDFDGVIVFDECHRAKNLCPTAGKSTKTGKFVLELQRALPSARVVYASATGATEPRNMAYMTRLGLWGQGQTFETFNDFIHAVENRGVGAMEMVAMDMKLRGLYLARQLSFKGVGFQVEEVELSQAFVGVYDEAVKVWMECRRQFARALSHMPHEMPKNQKVWAQFWSAHQRFFKYLCISAKVETCVKIALEAIANGKCIVIGLQSTGESQMLDYLEDNGVVTEFVSTAKAVLQGLIEKHFPTYDDNQASAIDDFERMFFSMDGENGKKNRKRRANDDAFVKKMNRREQSLESDKLYAERESGGNSEVEESDEYEDEDDDNNNEETVSEAEEEVTEDIVMKDKDAEDLVDAMMAELSSDDESDENSCKSSSLPFPVFGVKIADAKSDIDDFNPTTFGEINPFCVNLTEEDPWAENQRKLEDSLTSNKNNSQTLPDKVVKKRKIKKAKRKKPSMIMQTGAEEFIKSTNFISDADEHDGCMNLTQVKTDLLAAVEKLGKFLPSNTLDQLINQLGGPQYVAEMTGRRGRVITKEDTGKVQYELRNADTTVPVELMNMLEKEKFMNGEKLVAIISEAASSGISLQSDRRAHNHRRRVHITLELPWSADKAVQQFGRTHRSNQVNAPEYLFLISELAGEKRFASIVAKRLESLGALTHGDRRATESRDLSQFNIDTKYGREALEILFKTIVGSIEPLVPPPSSYTAGNFCEDMRVYMEGVGLLSKSSSGIYVIERDAIYIPKFLNRLLGLPVNAQNILFQYFSDLVSELIKQAKLDGTFDMGIMDIGVGSDRVQKAETRKFEGSLITNDFRVEMHKICLHRGVSWEEAFSILQLHHGSHDGFYVSTVGFHKRISIALVYGIGKSYDGANHHFYAVTRPNTGRSPKPETLDDLRQRFRPISIEEAKPYWAEQYEKLDNQCHHRYYHGKCNNEAQGRFCEVGRRTRTYFVLSGSVICVWPALEEILGEGKHNKHRRMQIVRVRTDSNQKVIGLLVLPIHVRKLVELLEQRCK